MPKRKRSQMELVEACIEHGFVPYLPAETLETMLQRAEGKERTGLPPEILDHLFRFLDYESMRAVRKVSREWRAVAVVLTRLHPWRLYATSRYGLYTSTYTGVYPVVGHTMLHVNGWSIPLARVENEAAIPDEHRLVFVLPDNLGIVTLYRRTVQGHTYVQRGPNKGKESKNLANSFLPTKITGGKLKVLYRDHCYKCEADAPRTCYMVYSFVAGGAYDYKGNPFHLVITNGPAPSHMIRHRSVNAKAVYVRTEMNVGPIDLTRKRARMLG